MELDPRKNKGCLPFLGAIGLGLAIALAPIGGGKDTNGPGQLTMPTTESDISGIPCSTRARPVESAQPDVRGTMRGLEPSGSTCYFSR